MDSTTMPRISFQRRTWLLLVVVVGLILAAPGVHPTPRALAAPAGLVQASKMYAVPTVSKWFPFEISLSATNNHANSYTDITVQAVFSGPDGARKDVRGFWDGGDIFRVRFTPTREGTWSYTISSTPSDPGLAAVGTLEVIPAPLGDHGFLRRDATYPYHFVFDDGTRLFMFGQTYYEIIRNAMAGESWKTAVDQSVAHGMTKVRLLLYPWPSDTNPYPDTEPFVNSSNHDELNLPHWRKLDEIIVYLRSRGMIADLILFADAGRVFGTLTQDQRYLRYAMARFAAYPNVIWCLTNEWNYTEKDMAYWDGMGEIVRSEDPWMEDDAGLRPLSIHQQTRHDFQFFGSSWPVHATIQDGVRNHDPRLLQGDEWGHYSITVNLGHNLPVVNDEYGYIGDQDLTMPRNPDGSYPALTRAKHRNILWGITMAGGYGSAGDIRTFDGSQAIFTSDWHDAVEYDDIRHMVDFWTTHGFEYWRMSPQQSMVVSGTRVYACGRPSRVYVVYAAEGGTFTLDLPEGPWDLTRFDPRTGEELVLGATPGGGKADFSMPDDRDWVLVLALKSPTFVDVPFSHPYHDDIEALYQAGYTAGCNSDPLMYCPENTMNRAESSVFVERGVHTTSYEPPPPASQVFADMPLDSWAAKWVNGLWQDGYTAGCGTSPLIYCPWQGHSRAEAAVFYLRMLRGADYAPAQPAGSIFADVPIESWYARWVHEAYNAGLIEPCEVSPQRKYCPDAPLTRALAAHMMAQAKGLIVSNWWRPAPGVTWQWQITGKVDETVEPAQMFDIDLTDAIPSDRVVAVPGFGTVTWPKGINAGVIDRLHAQGKVVICYLDSGAFESYEPDASLFPASVIGNNTGWDEENWLDIRQASWPAFAPLIWARFQLAHDIGCDGVEPDQNNPLGNNPGFPITEADQKAWYLEVASQAHARGLSVGMKNGIETTDSDTVAAFDWNLNEECFQYEECDVLTPFITAGKAVFQVEYTGSTAVFCPDANRRGFSSMKKRLALDAWREICFASAVGLTSP